MCRFIRTFLFACSTLSFAAAVSAQTNVLTYHNDLARTGQNLSETILATASVKPGNFGRLMTITLDGKVDAQPLYVSGLSIPGYGTHNVVFAATEHDSVYAIDANSGQIYWRVSLVGEGETTSDTRSCDQVTPEIGITATPVIDTNADVLYAMAMSKDSSGNYYQRLHALRLQTGAEVAGSPQTVRAAYPGTGANSSNGQVVFDAKQYKDRPGLLLLNGVVYTSWGSHCDINPYTGWIIGYNSASLQQTSVFNLAPNGSEAALWNSGGAPAADAQGNIYVSVANGTFDTKLNPGGFPSAGDYGNAFVKLTVNGHQISAADYWTMYNSNAESRADTDLGSGGVMLLPDVLDGDKMTRHLAVGAGKDSNLYVIDRDKMGKFDSGSDDTIYQQLTGALPGGIWGNPAYFNGRVYFGPQGSAAYAFEITAGKLTASSATTHSFPYPGVTPSISANGSSNGIVWVAENANPAVLHAYDSADLGSELYNSTQAASGHDNFGSGNKFVTPTIANGQVFVGTTTGIGVFGILPAATLPNGEYTMFNQLSTLVIDAPGGSATSGTQMIQSTLTGATDQKWHFTANGSGYYTICNAASGLCLTDPKGSTMSGTALEQATGDGSDSQLWSLRIYGSGYVIRNKASELAMEDAGASLVNGNKLDLAPARGQSSQAWVVE